LLAHLQGFELLLRQGQGRLEPGPFRGRRLEALLSLAQLRQAQVLQLLQAGGAAAQLLASRPIVGQLILGVLNGRLGRLKRLLGAP
jgi:hypothetical protein